MISVIHRAARCRDTCTDTFTYTHTYIHAYTRTRFNNTHTRGHTHTNIHTQNIFRCCGLATITPPPPPHHHHRYHHHTLSHPVLLNASQSVVLPTIRTLRIEPACKHTHIHTHSKRESLFAMQSRALPGICLCTGLYIDLMHPPVSPLFTIMVCAAPSRPATGVYVCTHFAALSQQP